MSLQKTELGWILASKRRGASHRRKNISCQDAYARSKMVEGKPCIALAVADGHGDVKHDFSEQGATLAVTIAVKTLIEFFNNFANNPTLLKKNFKQDFPRLVGRHWRQAVLKDAANRLHLQTDNPIDTSQLLKRYGTTLLVALILPDLLLLGQLGDGDILRLFPDGDLCQPFSHATELIGNATYSLSSLEADKFWQTATLARTQEEALLLATDGLSNAFIDETQFHTFARSLLTRISEFGIESIDAALPHWLDQYSEEGSGDDITLLTVISDQ
jgi:serine/threonine protein phosphatase PrpC